MTEPTRPYTLTTQAWDTIEPILIRLYKLRPGARLPVSFKLPAYANRARDWLYTYFKEMNLKPLYKIRRESKTSFSILCLEQFAPIFNSEDIYNSTETFVRDYLLDIDTEEEAREIAQKALNSGDLTDTSFLAIMDEYRRAMGTDKPAISLGALDSLPDTLDESIKRSNTAGKPNTEEGGLDENT